MTAQSYHTETAAEVAHALDKRPKKSGSSWRVPCPAHGGDDRNLSIADGDAGSLRLVCFSRGCSYKDILAALRDKGVVGPIRQWTYPNGKVVTRTDSPEGDKDFTSPGETAGTPLLVFSDDGLSPIVVCEGESDAQGVDDAMFLDLEAPMHNAASYPHGAGSAALADYAIVEGRAVVVWPDFDDAGRKAGKTVADACQLAGAISISFVADGVEGAADLSPDAIIAALENVTRTYPQRLRMTLQQLSELPPPSYLVDGLLINGDVTLMIGRPKDGKSQMIASLLAENFRHGTWLGKPTPPLRALVISEMGPELFLSYFSNAGIAYPEIGERLGFVGLSDMMQFGTWDSKLAWIGADIRAQPVEDRSNLIIVDTLGAFATATDWNNYADSVKVLGPVNQLAMSTGISVLLAHHTRKSESDVVDSVSGSSAISGSVSTLARLIRDKRHHGDTGRVLGVNSRLGGSSERFLDFDHTTGFYAVTRPEDRL